MTILPILSMGGAYADVADGDAAFAARRSSRYNVGMEAIGRAGGVKPAGWWGPGSMQCRR